MYRAQSPTLPHSVCSPADPPASLTALSAFSGIGSQTDEGPHVGAVVRLGAFPSAWNETVHQYGF